MRPSHWTRAVSAGRRALLKTSRAQHCTFLEGRSNARCPQGQKDLVACQRAQKGPSRAHEWTTAVLTLVWEELWPRGAAATSPPSSAGSSSAPAAPPSHVLWCTRQNPIKPTPPGGSHLLAPSPAVAPRRQPLAVIDVHTSRFASFPGDVC